MKKNNDKNKNKVYYGEYSLQHWVDLILKKNVVLPEYQRNFVWTEEKREELIKSIENKEFIPPVIIGSFNNKGKKENLLIDGQQRLTSILLSVLGYFPDREKYKRHQNRFVDEEDRNEDSDGENNVIDWSFSDLLEEANTIDSLRKKLEINEYFKKIKRKDKDDNNDCGLKDDFLKNNYLGFSYLVPNNNKKDYQQKYYSSVFRNINIQGQNLLAQESRASLYYLDITKKSFFDPDFLSKKLIENAKLDFVRYLAILSYYEKHKSDDLLCRGYGNNLENFYVKYIDTIIKGENSKDFLTYTELFKNETHTNILLELEKEINDLQIFKQKFDSIIDLDLIFFGLIYRIVFEKKSIDHSRTSKLLDAIKAKSDDYKLPILKDSGITDYKRNNIETHFENPHKKNPSALKYLTLRVKESIRIYSNIMGD